MANRMFEPSPNNKNMAARDRQTHPNVPTNFCRHHLGISPVLVILFLKVFYLVETNKGNREVSMSFKNAEIEIPRNHIFSLAHFIVGGTMHCFVHHTDFQVFRYLQTKSMSDNGVYLFYYMVVNNVPLNILSFLS